MSIKDQRIDNREIKRAAIITPDSPESEIVPSH